MKKAVAAVVVGLALTTPVRAIDGSGNADPTPAKDKFKVVD